MYISVSKTVKHWRHLKNSTVQSPYVLWLSTLLGWFGKPKCRNQVTEALFQLPADVSVDLSVIQRFVTGRGGTVEVQLWTSCLLNKHHFSFEEEIWAARTLSVWKFFSEHLNRQGYIPWYTAYRRLYILLFQTWVFDSVSLISSRAREMELWWPWTY